MGTLRALLTEPAHYTVPRRRAAKKLPGSSGLITLPPDERSTELPAGLAMVYVS